MSPRRQDLAQLTPDATPKIIKLPKKGSGKRVHARVPQDQENDLPQPVAWKRAYSYALLALATCACLLPFSGRAFHVDDPLFVWTAQQITKTPLDPYRFHLIWDITDVPMFEVTQNPPLASYYAALAGSLWGWSERSLHLAFLLPGLALVLGTYRLALRFTRLPLIAALATLFTPGFLVSASSVMSDIAMVALWVIALALWIEGFEERKPFYLTVSALLIAGCALTKYFGVCLIPLCFVYSVAKLRRVGLWAAYLFIPLVSLVGYQLWTAHLYGHGLLLGATAFAQSARALAQASTPAKTLVAASYAGGCMLPALIFAPLTWTRRQIMVGVLASGTAALFIVKGWVNLGAQVGGGHLSTSWLSMEIQLALLIAGGLSVASLPVADYWKGRDHASVLLALWVFGTLVFAAFLNWTTNIRSLLPLVPAAGILLARRIETGRFASPQWREKVIAALIISGFIGFWVASGDAAMANSAREAASHIHEIARHQNGNVWFEGHWGFQYYMQSFGAQPLDILHPALRPGDLLVIPQDNVQPFPIQPGLVESRSVLKIDMDQGITTNNWIVGAGFYASLYGPLPFVIGPVPPEKYLVERISPAIGIGAPQP